MTDPELASSSNVAGSPDSTSASTPPAAPAATATPGRRKRGLRIRAVGLIGIALILAAGSQLTAAGRASPFAPPAAVPPGALGDPVVGADLPPLDVIDTGVGGGAGGVVVGSTTVDPDTDRIRANIAFWAAKLSAHANDFVAAEKLGESQIELARATGDLTAYVAADAAFDTALRLYPDMPAASAFKGVVLVSLHRFDEARTLATRTLETFPDDPTSLATLGDASLELGDVAAARTAYRRLASIAPGAAASVRLGHLAFIEGNAAAAVTHARAAVGEADADEEAIGERAGFYRYQLADTLLATGDRSGATKAYRDALAHDPRSFLAHAGLGRVLAADGRIDAAIGELTAAIAIVPQPDMLARRADLYELRGTGDDAKLAAKDRATVLAIAQLGTATGSVYDRTLALYLANHGLDAERAVELATAELTTRKDVYGYDTLAWALLAAGRPAEADEAMGHALAFGTRDAKLLYHAGMIRLALGDVADGRARLEAALDLDPSFDALQADRARAALSGN